MVVYVFRDVEEKIKDNINLKILLSYKETRMELSSWHRGRHIPGCSEDQYNVTNLS